MKLQDKVTVITGGSEGFGKALARVCQHEGANVVISSNETERLQEAAQELSSDSFYADVTILEDVQKLGEYVIQQYGRIDLWINNAGIQIAPSLLEDIDPMKARRLFDVNYFGYLHGSMVAVSHMKRQGSGVIMNINSTAGLDGKPGISAYVSSKFAVKGLTLSLREELKGTGIMVLGVFPGGMQTDIYKEKYPTDLEEYMHVGPVAEKVIRNVQATQPEEDLVIKRQIKHK